MSYVEQLENIIEKLEAKCKELSEKAEETHYEVKSFFFDHRGPGNYYQIKSFKTLEEAEVAAGKEDNNFTLGVEINAVCYTKIIKERK